MFVVIEGADCSGKTTVGEILSHRSGITTIETPPPPFASIKSPVLNTCTPMARLLYFLASDAEVGAKAQATNGLTLAIRYLWSTFAYHIAIFDLEVEDIRVFIDASKASIPLPDMVVYLDVDRNQQLRRAQSRPDTGLQYDLMRSEEFQAKLRRSYSLIRNEFPTRWVMIDTSKLSPDLVANELLSAVGGSGALT